MPAGVDHGSLADHGGTVEELQALNLVYSGLLQKAKNELSILIEMMDPYYSQGGCYSDAADLIVRINCAMGGPSKFAPHPPPPITCSLCNGAKALRAFKGLIDLERHQQAVHGLTGACGN